MTRTQRFRTALLALCLAGAPSAAQLGPSAPPAANTTSPGAAEAFTRPPAEIPSTGETPPSEAGIPLGAPSISDTLPNLSRAAQAPADAVPERASNSGMADILRTVGALVLVIALILALAWGVRRLARSQGGLGAKLSAGGKSPSGILEVLGRYPVSGKLSLVVLRFDRRVLLITQTHGSSGAMSTLCELDDPSDVASVLSRVSASSESVNAAFREAIAHAERDVATALTPETRVPLDHFDPGSRLVTQTDDGDRLELLSDGDEHAFATPGPEISPLRRRLDAMRAGVGV